MDIETFRENCEKVVLVEELHPVSRLRQKVEGCYTAFGMCPEGETVALDMKGCVNCLKADLADGHHLCEDGGMACILEAEPSDILGVIELLRHFLLKNFTTKEGVLPEEDGRKAETPTEPAQTQKEEALSERDYEDEDLGVSRYLPDNERAKRRQDRDKGNYKK